MSKSSSVSLEKLGLTNEELSGALTDYFRESATVEYIETDNESVGSMYNTYDIRVGYAFDNGTMHDKKEDEIRLIAKQYMGNGTGAKTYDGREKQRKDLHFYEATVLRAMYEMLGDETYVPRFVFNNKDLVIMEHLGYDNLESILLNKDKRHLINKDLFDQSIKRIAGFHNELNKIASIRFKNTSSANYTDNFENYIGEIWKASKGGELSNDFRKVIRESFSVVEDKLDDGNIANNYPSINAIHQDFHPPHIFFKVDNKYGTSKLIPYFIDFKPRVGPVQFDLVDVIAHPLTSVFFRDMEKNLQEYAEQYMIEKVKSALRPSIITANGFSVTDEALADFIGMMHLSRVYRGIRAASKSFSIEMSNPRLYKQYVDNNKQYPFYRYWYIADAINSLEHLLGSNGSYYLTSEETTKLEKLHNILSINFKEEASKKDEVARRLNIDEEEKI